jgi:hypothetical protein
VLGREVAVLSPEVTGSDSHWYKNVLKTPATRLAAGEAQLTEAGCRVGGSARLNGWAGEYPLAGARATLLTAANAQAWRRELRACARCTGSQLLSRLAEYVGASYFVSEFVGAGYVGSQFVGAAYFVSDYVGAARFVVIFGVGIACH